MTDLTTEQIIEKRSYGVVTLEWLKRFARVSGDDNPIHQDEVVAKQMGLPGVIAHGMLVAGLVHSRAETAVAECSSLKGSLLGKSTARFRAMTFLGDEVFVGGFWHHAEKDRVVIDLAAENQRGEILVQCQIALRNRESQA